MLYTDLSPFERRIDRDFDGYTDDITPPRGENQFASFLGLCAILLGTGFAFALLGALQNPH